MSSKRSRQSITNIHANSLVIGNKGILICGEPGSGKTSLMFRLLEQAALNNQFSAMVADDQSLISSANGHLVAHCPSTINGKVEIRGSGIVDADNLPSAVINLIVNIISPDNLERMPEPESVTLNSITLPSIGVPRFREAQSARMIIAALAVKS